MTIQEIYTHYSIPPVLQKHMLTVAALADLVASHWINENEPIDRRLIVTTALLHDMGNIIKFNLDTSPFLPPEELPHWKKIQNEFVSKYGSDEHRASAQIAKELRVDRKVIDQLTATGELRAEMNLLEKDWNFAIVFYADFRVSPEGVVTLDTRINDLLTRYKNKASSVWSHKDKAEEWRSITKKLEVRMQKNVSLSLSGITQDNIGDLTSLSSYQVSQDVGA